MVEKLNHITTLHEAVTKISFTETVSVIVYIDLKEAKPVKINNQHGIKKNQKVIAYDNSYSDHIKLTLWNVHIDSIAKNGVYRLQSVKVKLPNNNSRNSYQGIRSRN